MSKWGTSGGAQGVKLDEREPTQPLARGIIIIHALLMAAMDTVYIADAWMGARLRRS